MKHETTKNFSLFIITIGLIAFIYISIKAFAIVQKTQISTSDGIYTNRVTTSEEIKEKAFELSKKCQSELCEVQSILDYVTHIPYKINHFQAHSPQRTIQLGFGDCDDKSNLLISMLHALDKEVYFVLVPKHIFVIAPLEDKRLGEIKGLWLDEKKYFILESTAKGSPVGYPLQYSLDEINVVMDPFTNEKYAFKQIAWR